MRKCTIVSFSFMEEDRIRLAILSTKKHMTKSELVREAIKEYEANHPNE